MSVSVELSGGDKDGAQLLDQLLSENKGNLSSSSSSSSDESDDSSNRGRPIIDAAGTGKEYEKIEKTTFEDYPISAHSSEYGDDESYGSRCKSNSSIEERMGVETPIHESWEYMYGSEVVANETECLGQGLIGFTRDCILRGPRAPNDAGVPCTVKVLRPQRTDPKFVDAFRAQVKACYELSRDIDINSSEGETGAQNVARVLGGTFYGTLTYVCKKDFGKTFSLQDLIMRLGAGNANEKAMKLRLCVAREVASGMLFLHAHEIVHGQLKPKDVIMTIAAKTERVGGSNSGSGSGSTLVEAKIRDYGMHGVRSANLRDGALVSPEYLAPEVLDGGFAEDTFTKMADVYSYGCLLWQLFTGSGMLLESYGPRFRDNVEVVPLDFAPSIPPKICALIRACCAQRAADRPSFSAIMHKLSEDDAALLSSQALSVDDEKPIVHTEEKDRQKETINKFFTKIRECLFNDAHNVALVNKGVDAMVSLAAKRPAIFKEAPEFLRDLTTDLLLNTSTSYAPNDKRKIDEKIANVLSLLAGDNTAPIADAFCSSPEGVVAILGDPAAPDALIIDLLSLVWLLQKKPKVTAAADALPKIEDIAADSAKDVGKGAWADLRNGLYCAGVVPALTKIVAERKVPATKERVVEGALHCLSQLLRDPSIGNDATEDFVAKCYGISACDKALTNVNIITARKSVGLYALRVLDAVLRDPGIAPIVKRNNAEFLDVLRKTTCAILDKNVAELCGYTGPGTDTVDENTLRLRVLKAGFKVIGDIIDTCDTNYILEYIADVLLKVYDMKGSVEQQSTSDAVLLMALKALNHDNHFLYLDANDKQRNEPLCDKFVDLNTRYAFLTILFCTILQDKVINCKTPLTLKVVKNILVFMKLVLVSFTLLCTRTPSPTVEFTLASFMFGENNSIVGNGSKDAGSSGSSSAPASIFVLFNVAKTLHNTEVSRLVAALLALVVNFSPSMKLAAVDAMARTSFIQSYAIPCSLGELMNNATPSSKEDELYTLDTLKVVEAAVEVGSAPGTALVLGASTVPEFIITEKEVVSKLFDCACGQNFEVGICAARILVGLFHFSKIYNKFYITA